MSSEVFGWDLAVDCAECDLDKITNAEHIKAFVRELVEDIDMKSFGECVCVKFGEGKLEGFSVVQLIHTSCITIHFQDYNRSAYFNIFSCKVFQKEVVKKSILKWFSPKFIKMNMLERSVP